MVVELETLALGPHEQAHLVGIGGDEADATSDGGAEPTKGAEPDLKDAAAAPRQVDVESADPEDRSHT